MDRLPCLCWRTSWHIMKLERRHMQAIHSTPLSFTHGLGGGDNSPSGNREVSVIEEGYNLHFISAKWANQKMHPSFVLWVHWLLSNHLLFFIEKKIKPDSYSVAAKLQQKEGAGSSMEREKKMPICRNRKLQMKKKKGRFCCVFKKKMENKRQVLKEQVCNEKMVD